MNVQQIRAIARERGLKPGNASKVELVRAIQRSEGNSDCFARADSNFCDQTGCLWREDCMPAPKKRNRPD
jgi:hypothetical protein